MNSDTGIRFLFRMGLTLCVAGFLTWFIGLGGLNLPAALSTVGVLIIGISIRKSPTCDTLIPSNVLDRGLSFIERRIEWLVFLLTSIYGIIWTVHYLFQYYSLDLGNYDAGIYSSIAFNTAHGHPFFSSVFQVNHLGRHFSPIMAVFAILYAIKPSLLWLLGAQALAYITVPFLFLLIARQLIPDRKAAALVTLMLSMAWFIYRPINQAMHFPFHPPTLTLPFILLAFYFLERKAWFRMTALLFFLLLFKENLALVWVGFGLYLFFGKKDHGRGIFFTAAGIIFFFLIIYVIMPAFRSHETWWALTRLGPLDQPAQKAYYLFRLIAPLLFLPAIYWRYGLIALPAICLNLVSGSEPQFSSGHHYDDFISVLLFTSAIPAIADLTRARWGSFSWKGKAAILLAAFFLTMFFCRKSPLSHIRKDVPTGAQIETIRELRRLDREFAGTFFYVQDHLGPQLYRYEQTQFPIDLPSYVDEDFKPGSLIVLSEKAHPWGILNMKDCLESFAKRPDRFEPVPGYSRLTVYRVRNSGVRRQDTE